MRALKLLVVAAVAGIFATNANATVLDNLQQITDGTSNTLLFDETGDVSVACSDGSVRTVAGPTVTCADGSVRTVRGSDTLACTDFGDGSVRQIGISLHDGGINHDVVCNDGSVRVVPGNGSGAFILPFLEQAAVCFSHPIVGGTITDGTSNTILFGESAGLHVTPGFNKALAPIRTISDGTSNTIIFDEFPSNRLPSSGFCLGNTNIGDPFVGGAGDGGSVFVGGNARFDLCFGSARIGFADGTSNTILFGEAQSNVCIQDVAVGPDLAAVEVPEPSAATLLLPAAAAVATLRRRSKRLSG